MSDPAAAPKRFSLGLVVGKFAPLHLGHEWLIGEAARQCDNVLLLSYTNPEFDRCGPKARERWLAQRFPQHEAIVLGQGSLAKAIPPNDSDDETHQRFLAWLLKSVLKRSPDVLFCCEAYGPACAAVLSNELQRKVTAVVVDRQRAQFACSASQIRRDPHGLRHYLAPEVRVSFVKRIAILGGESSGKTTLASALASHFNTGWVPEYGRELWEQQGGKLLEEDLLRIGTEQIRREDAELLSATRYLFCDTSPLTTVGYASWMFGRVDPQLESLGSRPYDGVVLCQPDFPFVQDGTRRDGSFRLEQHAWYQERVGAMRCPVLEVGGGVSQRISLVATWVTCLDVR